LTSVINIMMIRVASQKASFIKIEVEISKKNSV